MTLESNLRRDVDNYEQTIGALLAIAQHVGYAHSVKSWFGRKFHTSNQNRVSPNTDVRPDLSVQFDDTYGIVVEAKKNFSRYDDYDDGITQAKKYDDLLKGWNTANELIAKHDIVLLTELLRGVQLEEYLNRRRAEFDPNRNIIIVEFNRTEEVNTFFELRRRQAVTFSLPKLDEKFKIGFGVRIEHLLPLGFSEIKFYDAEPPVAHTLQVIWDNILSEIPTEEDYRKAGGKRKIEIVITIDELCEKLKQFAPKQDGIRLPEIPKKEWIERAMKTLVEIKLAKQFRNSQRRIEPGKYVINYRKFKRGNGSLDIFIPKIAENMRQQRLA